MERVVTPQIRHQYLTQSPNSAVDYHETLATVAESQPGAVRDLFLFVRCSKTASLGNVIFFKPHLLCANCSKNTFSGIQTHSEKSYLRYKIVNFRKFICTTPPLLLQTGSKHDKSEISMTIRQAKYYENR